MTGTHKRTLPDGRERRTTIADLSAALGLTKGTVSRALNDYPDISERTRARVRRAAQDMGYRPLAHAQAIRTGRVRALGFVIEMAEYDAHRPFMAAFLAGMSSSASAEGWTLTVAAAASPEETLETMARLHSERKADGFVIPRTRRDDSRIAMLRDRNIPFVMFGRSPSAAEAGASYDIAGEDAMRRAVTMLHGLGHRRIAFINGGAAYNYSRLRAQGYQEGLAAVDLPQDPAIMAEGCLTAAAGRAAAARMLALPVPPTAFVYALDQAALGLYPLAASLGLQIGKDLSVIAYDGIPKGADMVPPLATFAVDVGQAGARLGALLIRHIRGDAAADLRELAQAQFLDRGSAGAPALSPVALEAHLRAADLHAQKYQREDMI